MKIVSTDGFKAAQAVVDWVEFEVELKKHSHGGFLKKTYEHLGVSVANPLDKGLGGAASKFSIRLQHPNNYELIGGLLRDIELRYGLLVLLAPTEN